jgi:hypothetical protein
MTLLELNESNAKQQPPAVVAAIVKEWRGSELLKQMNRTSAAAARLDKIFRRSTGVIFGVLFLAAGIWWRIAYYKVSKLEPYRTDLHTKIEPYTDRYNKSLQKAIAKTKEQEKKVNGLFNKTGGIEVVTPQKGRYIVIFPAGARPYQGSFLDGRYRVQYDLPSAIPAP